MKIDKNINLIYLNRFYLLSRGSASLYIIQEIENHSSPVCNIRELF
jgi:hypothetical protein